MALEIKWKDLKVSSASMKIRVEVKVIYKTDNIFNGEKFLIEDLGSKITAYAYPHSYDENEDRMGSDATKIGRGDVGNKLIEWYKRNKKRLIGELS